MTRNDLLHGHRIMLAFLTLLLLAGCGLRSAKPTALPWLPTQTPYATAAPQAGFTATATPAQTEPTATPIPTSPTLTPEPTYEAVAQTLTLETPTTGAQVDAPIKIRGQAKVMPFEGTLVIRIYNDQRELLIEKPIIADGDLGGPANFEVDIDVGAYTGPAHIEILDLSARDGSEIARATVSVTVKADANTAAPGTGDIQRPAAEATITLPIQLLARVGEPRQTVQVIVQWEDGTRLNQTLTTLAGLDGRGYLLAPIDFAESPTTHPPTQPATLEIRTQDDVSLAIQHVHILAPDDPETLETHVYWIVNEDLMPQRIRIPRTLGIGRASLEALLWGPSPHTPEGYISFIPAPADILSYPGRGPDWGERISIQHLRIEDGVAYVDFSPELQAHAGGALTTTLIKAQIEATLTQFATVDDVVISINGMTGVLEP